MGQVKKILSTFFMPLQIWEGLQRFVAAEDLHLYWRNFRIAMKPEVFEDFAKRFAAGLYRWTKLGKPVGSDLVMFNAKINERGKQSEVVVEQNENDVIHIHYADIRIELDKVGFCALVNGLKNAMENLE